MSLHVHAARYAPVVVVILGLVLGLYVAGVATLPGLDELRGKIVGLLQAPAQKIAAVLQAPASQLARVTDARRAQLEEGGS